MMSPTVQQIPAKKNNFLGGSFCQFFRQESFSDVGLIRFSRGADVRCEKIGRCVQPTTSEFYLVWQRYKFIFPNYSREAALVPIISGFPSEDVMAQIYGYPGHH